MGRTKGIIGGLTALREPAQAIFLTQSSHAIPPTCQNFMRITLMANVPDQFIFGRVKHSVERNS